MKVFRRCLDGYLLSSVFALLPVAGVATGAIRALSKALDRQRPELLRSLSGCVCRIPLPEFRSVKTV
jgi:hypothetical protein